MAADERAAFDALYEDTHRRVLAYYVRRTSRWPDASDAAADTYVVVWRRFDDLPQGDGRLGVRHLQDDGEACRWLRKRARAQRYLDARSRR